MHRRFPFPRGFQRPCVGLPAPDERPFSRFVGLKFNTGFSVFSFSLFFSDLSSGFRASMLLPVNTRVIKITSDVAGLKLGLLLYGSVSAVIHSV